MKFNKLLKSPFLHFLLLGLGIFLLNGWINRDAVHPEAYDIVITKDQQAQMVIMHQRNFGELPDSATLQKLIDAEIKNEIYYREALRLGLDQNDEIIRRRLKQKYEFIQNDQLEDQAIREDVLLKYYTDHQKDYQAPALYSFQHFYFSPDRRADPMADAQAFLNNNALPSDDFHISSPITSKSALELRELFGLAFYEGIINDIEFEKDRSYVLPSGFGAHLIRLTDFSMAAPMSFDEVKDQVQLDYLNHSRSVQNTEAFGKLKRLYQVDVE